jgi:hypothetical protein
MIDKLGQKLNKTGEHISQFFFYCIYIKLAIPEQVHILKFFLFENKDRYKQ